MWKWPKFKAPSLPKLPKQTGPFPAREWRAHVALIASIFGAIAFTFFAMFMVYIIWKGGWAAETAVLRLEILGKVLILSLSGALVVLISLGFAINRRTVKITKNGLEASGGDGHDPNDDTNNDDEYGPRRTRRRRSRRYRNEDDGFDEGFDDFDLEDQGNDDGFFQDANEEEDRTSVFEEPEPRRRRRR